MPRLARILTTVTRWLLPQRCDQCQAVTTLSYCEACLSALPWQSQSHVSDGGIAVVSLSPYDHVMKTIMHDIKFAKQRELALQLGKRLAIALATASGGVDLSHRDAWVAVPVPSVASRTAERGFHHVEVVFEALCVAWDIPLIPAVIRSKDTQQLHTLGKAARWAETDQAFTVVFPEAIQDKHILIIDDILTTGATVDAMAIVCMRSGAGSVQGLVLATGKRVG